MTFPDKAKNPIDRFVKSVICALSGISFTFTTERHFKFHAVAAIIAIGLGFYLQISAGEWGLIVLSIGIVLVSELFNTALERACDEIAGGKLRELVKRAKDTSAGAVLLSAITALVIGVIVLIIPLIHRIF
jgi:diacylglycerol kinase